MAEDEHVVEEATNSQARPAPRPVKTVLVTTVTAMATILIAGQLIPRLGIMIENMVTLNKVSTIVIQTHFLKTTLLGVIQIMLIMRLIM